MTRNLGETYPRPNQGYLLFFCCSFLDICYYWSLPVNGPPFPMTRVHTTNIPTPVLRSVDFVSGSFRQILCGHGQRGKPLLQFGLSLKLLGVCIMRRISKYIIRLLVEKLTIDLLDEDCFLLSEKKECKWFRGFTKSSYRIV